MEQGYKHMTETLVEVEVREGLRIKRIQYLLVQQWCIASELVEVVVSDRQVIQMVARGAIHL